MEGTVTISLKDYEELKRNSNLLKNYTHKSLNGIISNNYSIDIGGNFSPDMIRDPFVKMVGDEIIFDTKKAPKGTAFFIHKIM